LHGAQVTELAFGFLASLFTAPALSDQVVDLGFEMKAQLVFHVGGWVRAEQAGVASP
jgi:hypothetical protein